MKRKNLFLAAITFTLAIGSAFASLLLPEVAHIRARPTPSSAFVCYPCQEARCDIQAPFVCRISVNTIVSGVKVVRGRRPPTFQCAPSFYYNQTVQPCGVTVYDAQ